MKTLTLFLLKFYKIVFSPVLVGLFGNACKYETTCSSFAIHAIEEHGFGKGSALAVRRFLSCNSFATTN